jgi:hypothetical protein
MSRICAFILVFVACTAIAQRAASQTAADQPSPSSAVAASNPEEILRSAKTIHVATRTTYFTPETLERDLAKQKDFFSLGLLIVNDTRVADLLIAIDRPLFSYTFTYSVTDSKTSIVLDTGKVTAIDGTAAAGKIAKQLVAKWGKLRHTDSATKTN